jgi:UDP-N-acetylglucosamine--N-acetylmuramyl-(pentapeptide) pyrophosphoryl-undecaprenol N-acetylglucosamine transferase
MSAGPIMIMAGGTGGHVFPGLAVAAELKARQREVVWLGTQRGLEARLVPQHGIEIEWISIAGVRGRGPWAWATAPFRIAGAVIEALRALRRRRPAAVLGMGGFVAGPGGLAAWLTRRPLIIHEQNSVAGTTNRLLAPLAARVFEAFPGSFPARAHAELVGNPVRRSLQAAEPPRRRVLAREGQRRRVLVIGGSQGARILNATVAAAITQLPAELRPEIWHQAGRGVAEARAAYAAASVEARIDEFIDDMSAAYQWADLVVARSGALTVAELAMIGVGAILVPFKAAIDDHQTLNARHFAQGGAAVVIAEQDLTAGTLARDLAACLGDLARLATMAEAAHAHAKHAVAERIAAACVAAAEVRA